MYAYCNPLVYIIISTAIPLLTVNVQKAHIFFPTCSSLWLFSLHNSLLITYTFYFLITGTISFTFYRVLSVTNYRFIYRVLCSLISVMLIQFVSPTRHKRISCPKIVLTRSDLFLHGEL